MSGTRIGLLLAVGMGLLAAPVAAQPSAVDRTRLDALIAQIEKAEPEDDQAAYRALAGETLADARRLYPDRKSVWEGKSVSISVALGGPRIQIKNNKNSNRD